MRHQLILPFDADAFPAYYDEEPDPEHDPLYPRQPVIVPAALHGSPFDIDELDEAGVRGTAVKENHIRLPALYDEEGYPVIQFHAEAPERSTAMA